MGGRLKWTSAVVATASAIATLASPAIADTGPVVFGDIENTNLLYTAEGTDSVVNEVVDKIPTYISTEGGWRNKTFWIPRATYASGSSTQVSSTRTGFTFTNGATRQGDTYFSSAVTDGHESYDLYAEIQSGRSVNYDVVNASWAIVDDPSGSCTLSGNVLSGGGAKASVKVSATDEDLNIRYLTLAFGGYRQGTKALVQNPVSEVSGTFRKAYTDAILQKFAGLDYGTGHIFPYTMRPNPYDNYARNFSCGRINIPWELELYDRYENFIRTGNYFAGWFNGSTNGTFHTQGRSDPSPTCSYKECLISAAKGATHLNGEFFWPQLQDAMRCFSAARGDWYMEKHAVKISKHYILAATHAKQTTHRFFKSDGSYVNVSASNIYNFQGWDLTLQYCAAGIPDDVPCLKFLGRHGSETYSSLWNLSPSFLRGAPALRKTMYNTVSMFYPSFGLRDESTFLHDYEFDMDFENDEGVGVGIAFSSVISPSYYFSTTKKNTSTFVNSSYPAMNKAAAWTTNNLVIPVIPESLIKEKGASKIKIGDITEWTQYIKPNDSYFFPEGANMTAIPGDSSFPTFFYYNGNLWGLSLFWTAGGGTSLTRLDVQDAIEAYVRQDSAAKLGTSEGLTFIDCCTLDPNHTFHTH